MTTKSCQRTRPPLAPPLGELPKAEGVTSEGQGTPSSLRSATLIEGGKGCGDY